MQYDVTRFFDNPVVVYILGHPVFVTPRNTIKPRMHAALTDVSRRLGGTSSVERETVEVKAHLLVVGDPL